MTDPHPETRLRFQLEWCRVTLASIGDAVITTDPKGGITFLNPAAQSLTGWTLEEATGQPLASVFRIINEQSRQPVESPAVRALREGVVVGLANHSVLVARDGTERPIDDSAAPIRNEQGEVARAVLVFRDISERRRQEQAMQKALAYADDIIATVRQPFVVLDNDLRVRTANATFYRDFHASKEETEGRFVFELGNGQPVEDFEVEHAFPALGRRNMLLNARRFPPDGDAAELILLAIEDDTDHRRAEASMKDGG